MDNNYVNLNYLQKFYATKFTCNEDILTGYEATKIQLSLANIQLKSLKQLERGGTIYKKRKNFTKKNYKSQGKAFYQIFTEN